jgi:hypothetical protein
MQKSLCAVIASIVLATSAIATTASAEPRRNRRFHDQDRYIQNHCRSSWDNDCRDWDQNRNRWDETRYNRWYRDHDRHRNGPDDAAAAIFGFAAGAIAGAISGAAGGSHVAACDARYRSYDPGSDTFMGHDGQRHYCRL